MPLQQTSGNVTADAYGGGVAAVPNYIEDVFSTYLYTGNDSTQTINNGIDLAGKGGLLWVKNRTIAASHRLFDTARGANQYLNSASTGGTNLTDQGQSFTSTGFQFVGNFSTVNSSLYNYASWTFRKQPKFFDVVTYTGDGTNARAISHNLGSVPGCIIVKSLNAADDWYVYHRSLGATQAILLNSTGTAAAFSDYWSNTAPTSTQFTLGTPSGGVTNVSGTTYVAYIFAHNAGGFGLTGTDNVISCGSFTVDGSGNATVNLGYEPQYVLYKKTNSTGQWYIDDTMRGLYAPSIAGNDLFANLSNAESAGNGSLFLNSTGFTNNPVGNYVSGDTVIYIAIRRGPMKVPTDGTKVFAPALRNPTNGVGYYSGFPVDLNINRNRVYDPGAGGVYPTDDRLRGGNNLLWTNTTDAESGGTGTRFQSNVGYYPGLTGASSDQIDWMFRRAPGFFDEVCYTGTSASNTVTHNLAAIPELLIMKARNSAGYSWYVHAASQGVGNFAYLNLTNAFGASGGLTSTSSTNFVLPGGGFNTNLSGVNYVAYLFATCPGVSKVGSYTGNGSTQTINCGFTGGARFVLIKRTDSTGDWYVYDTARGMTTLTDPYLLLNSTAAETATLGSVTTVTTGFAVNAAVLAAINTNGASYIFLAIA